MGRNKKKPNPPPPPPNTATRAPPPPPPPPTNNPNQEQTEIDQERSLIKSKCDAVHATHKAGNSAHAFVLMEETRRRYEYISLVHAAQCKLHVLEASRIGTSDIVQYQSQVTSAIESAHRAVSLSPYAIKFGDFYAATLNRFSSSVEGFDEVLRVCERALSVGNPLQLCRDASLSLKSCVYEERSKMRERKNQAVSKANERAEMQMEKSRSYWNEMSDEIKGKLIGLKIGDLREYYSSFCKDGLAKRVFSEAIGYAEKNKNWKFWACHCCDEKFEDFELRMNHIERNHEWLIEQNLQMNPILIPEIGAEVYRDLQIVNGTIHSIKERIVLTGDPSGPLDDRLLRVKVTPHKHHDGVEDDENGSSSTDAEVAVPPDIDAFGQWLFDGPPTSTAEELVAWTHLQDQMKQQGMVQTRRFKEEFIQFQSLRRKQSELMVQTRFLRGIQIICAQELDKRKRGGDRVPYKSILSEKYKALGKTKDDSMSPTQQSEITVILGLLKEAGNVRQSESNLLKKSEVEDEEDTSIRVAIHNKISELFTNEAQITRSSAVMLRLLVIYKQSCLDYRGIMLPLVRNFIHAKLEKQKADDATEALLSELALEAEKNTSKGKSHPKVSKKTSKAKKKIKDHREVKDPKDTCSESSDKLTVAEEERAEQDDFPVVDATVVEEENAEQTLQDMWDLQSQFEKEAKRIALAKETMNEAAPTKAACSDELTAAQEENAEQAYFPVVAASADELNLQEEELRENFIQEDIKHNEMLGNQRQFEDEAKQMALAKETTTEAAPIKAITNGSYRRNPGLRNYLGEYSFVNVVVPSLWHLRKFRDMFMCGSTSEHVHIGDPCVVCKLKEIFGALSVASTNYQREALSPSSLRNALFKFIPWSDLLNKPHMYDACKVLAIILDSLYESSKLGSKQSWTCRADACVAPNIFGMYFVENMFCFSCGIESREITFMSCFCHVLEGSLRMIGQCGKQTRVRRYLTRPPQVFAIALFWDSPSKEDIYATLRALTTEIDLAVIHDGLKSGNKHSLSSMVCFAGQHHICFAYNQELEIWVMYDDEIFKNVGRWEDLICMCEEEHLQPHLLFFEAVK